MKAKIHNARACTLENVDCWIPVIYTGDQARPEQSAVGPEFDTSDKAVEWCQLEMARRGAPGAPIEVEQLPPDVVAMHARTDAERKEQTDFAARASAYLGLDMEDYAGGDVTMTFDQFKELATTAMVHKRLH
jgi:hypothetical protein